MKVLQLNHIALHVADVDTSVAFYRDVLQLEPLPRPAFDFPGAWFRLGIDQELHLIGNRDSAVHSASRGNHLALKVDDLDAWESHLQRLGARHNPRQVRPDGGLQVFLPDPDGHWIELLGTSDGA
ncbi:Lactoylglutathione lyase [Rosistilla oblonga]|uniref:Lactoylglutathione lyase n=1 Tax=Rosistilla oblonga TaxID=2527990 RepID=A0A518IXJ4_9BACT|nr:VOC family protein [Rosistilla oblonga]QDV14010.1 Lactoylglutathione lyase [Rosistilla oblonga]QDV57797.1 Lactoylglutathione lyase [Rosistilla oblonga]